MRLNDYIIRITYESFTKIQKVFRPWRDESMASYFDRLSKWLELMKQNDI